MCNPRRILVQASRMVCQNWHRQIQRVVNGQEEVAVNDRLMAELRLDESVGDAARAALVALVMNGFRGWRVEGEQAVLDLEPVTLRFDPVDGLLTVETSMMEVVLAAGRATRSVSGNLVGRVTVDREVQISEASGNDALDRWRAEAQGLDEQVGEEIRSIVWGRERDMSAELDAEARADLEERLESLTAEADARLRERAARALAEVEPQVRREIGTLLAETYKNALLAMAEEYGGEVLSQRESGGVVELEIQI